MTAQLVGLVVCALAAYRVARAIAVDTLFHPLRERLYHGAYEARHGRSRRVASTPTRWAYGLVSCPFCVGFWLSLGAWWLWRHEPGSRIWVAAVAVAGAQALFTSFDRGTWQ